MSESVPRALGGSGSVPCVFSFSTWTKAARSFRRKVFCFWFGGFIGERRLLKLSAKAVTSRAQSPAVEVNEVKDVDEAVSFRGCRVLFWS